MTVDARSGEIRLESRSMRGHFALRFGEERSDDGREVTRAGQVREAFADEPRKVLTCRLAPLLAWHIGLVYAGEAAGGIGAR